MTLPKLRYEHGGLTPITLREYEQKASKELQLMRDAASNGYKDDRASINLSLDKEHVRLAKSLAKKHNKTSLLIIVGIGGSNLGTWAVQEAVLGKRDNILYADTVDADNINNINERLKEAIKKKQHVVINGVSKSGGTSETIANIAVFISTLKKNGKDPKKHIVFTTDEDSKLWHFAKKNSYDVLPIPKKVGGRYSVFSPVGLFPLALLDVNINKLLSGAAAMRKECLKKRKNPAIIRAALLAEARKQTKNVADNFYFKTNLENVGKWYRQLMGESIGKEWDKHHTKKVRMGITPTVSIGSTDLHSMAQLYFGGPNDKFFSIVTVKKWKHDAKVPAGYESLVPSIKGKKLTSIMNAIVGGVVAVLKKQNRPFCTIELSDLSESSIGALLQLHMMEMMYLAAMLGVNPFDQPNVEEYKIETKRILAK